MFHADVANEDSGDLNHWFLKILWIWGWESSVCWGTRTSGIWSVLLL